ncbi:hypothetical protein N0M98_24555 [Paenibacillus doosanensis]|uniref:Alpha-L-rhamnosidase n=1 Tax=Paenibacillus konkukensis TaxID=2020716 RepID=A0ABY4RRK5_9BACL|nr:MULTISPECIES: hypothetical protein [Paenibacillus]MCS7463299.1 hypothetical protein [Paenibacillus doosanensis]UQZ85164.1 hypothetical protein SK3146_04447 [Paenibacillus konkukensis]
MKLACMYEQFAKVDPRYGPVPFWWWSAEEVTEERVRWQLRKFREGGMRNIGIINLAPTGPQYGSVSDRPAFSSEVWWHMFEVAVREAERLGMYVWFYDQIGFSGANMPARIVTERPEAAGYRLKRFEAGEELPPSAEVLYEADGYTYAAVRQGFNWLDPAASQELIDRVHGEMERRFPADLGRTIAGSFQDELPPFPLWTPELAELYRERHGDELLPLLPALFDPLPGSADVRRRVYRLSAELAERSFFIPLGRWHSERGMLLCCDQAGPARRADPHGAQRLYLDYFRTHRWYNAPGTDMDGEIKPHASMVHLHGGSRVFLEAFHSSGWGGTLEETMHWLIPWFQAGATVYSPHSVYYSTRGGWWEWAPPDTGWRQPYFEHYPVFADTISRICYMLSAGAHVCDIAVHYPSHAVCGYLSLADGKKNEHPMGVANKDPNEQVTHIQKVYRQVAGSWSRRQSELPGALRRSQLDFDIADDTALMKAVPEGARLSIAEESFAVVILCGTTVMDGEARRRLEQWLREGGFVIGVDVPEAERNWAGVVYASDAEEAAALIESRIPRRIEGPGEALHRRTEDADLFLLLPRSEELLAMHQPATPETAAAESAVYRLRTKRVPQLWNPVVGRAEPIAYERDGDWIEARVPFASWPAALIVCAEDEAAAAALLGGREPVAEEDRARVRPFPAELGDAEPAAGSGAHIELPSDDWRVRVEATLDNRYGDFDLHGAGRGFVPTERRMMNVRLEKEEADGEPSGWHLPGLDETGWLPRLWSEAAYWHVCKGERFDDSAAEPLVYSAVFGDLAMRSWAGRMGRVPRRFLNLGRCSKGEFVCARTYVMAPAAGIYWIRTESNSQLDGTVNGEEIAWNGGPEERTAWVELRAGSNELILRAQAIGNGLMRAAVEVSGQAREPLPKWLFSRNPSGQSALIKRVACEPGLPVERVRLVFAARGRAVLYVNGTKVTEHGDFNPYIRQGQEEVDVTALWRQGVNEVRFALPEGKGEVFADGVVEYRGGGPLGFCTGEDWRDERGEAPGVHHFSVLQFAETESLWIAARPHPLPRVGWLMPDSVPDPAPLPFSADPGAIGRPVWLRFPLPVGTNRLRFECAGEARLWIGGQEVAVSSGVAAFAPRPAGTAAVLRIVPAAAETEGAVLLSPIRMETAPVSGSLGDWRSALCLPHHSGAVEYERTLEVQGLQDAQLDLGHVRGTAEVWVNGQPLGVRLWRPYRFALPALPDGKHRLRIRVTNTLGTHYEIGRPTGLVGGNPDVAYWEDRGTQEERDWQRWFPSGGLYGPIRILAKSQPR